MNKKKKQGIMYIVFGLCLLMFAFLFTFFVSPSYLFIEIDEKIYTLEILKTPTEREKGLSQRDFLEANKAVLFEFEKEGLHGFWMKEMNFPISIIWLDDKCRVTGFKKITTPESYPEIFYPELPSKFVIEVNPLEKELTIAQQLNCRF